MIYLKLRNNISMEGDIQLARLEVSHLFGDVRDVTRTLLNDEAFPIDKEILLSYARPSDLVGFKVSNPACSLQKCVKLLSFIQEIWFTESDFEPQSVPYIKKHDSLCCAIPLMAMSEFVSYSSVPTYSLAEQIANCLSLNDKNTRHEKLISRAITSAPHVHSMHAYKAKFFPRFVRSLIVAHCDLSKDNLNVCDPYLGSGTTLVESRLMGFDSYGIDIDPLSCLISKTKVEAMDMNEDDLSYNSFFQHPAITKKHNYEFPAPIKKKFEKWDELEEMQRYQSAISAELDLIKTDSSDYQKIHKIALSDALTRKFNIRMMGTGSGRFALEISKTPLQAIIKSNLNSTVKAVRSIEILKRFYGLDLAQAHVSVGNATDREFEDELFNIIVTSPPYLPASSGREDYLVGKMISLKAMELVSDSEMDGVKTSSVGSMENNTRLDMMNLPESVIDLFNWLMADDLRRIKAAPIVTYYNSLRESLMEDARTLKQNGRIIYIIGKESVFYSMATKEILYKVECDKIFMEIAESIGLKVVDHIDIELDKKSAVARPRSTDKYYECAIILAKE